MEEFLKYNFIDNDSRNSYIKIIEEYKNKKLECYTEKHHILPKSLGGSNNKNNLVEVPLLVHYELHKLLPEFSIGPDHYKMMFAYSFVACVHKRYDDFDRTILTKYNPSKRPEVRKKISIAAKNNMRRRKEEGWINPFTTPEVIDQVSKRATIRNNTNNPMKNPEFAEKHNAALRGRNRPDMNTTYRIVSDDNDVTIVGLKPVLDYLGVVSGSTVMRFLKKGGIGNIGKLKNVIITRS